MSYVPVLIVGGAVVLTGGALYMLAARRRASFALRYQAVMRETAREAAEGVVTDKNVTSNLQRALLDRSYIYSPQRTGGQT